jgi:hypothetical protein
MPGAINRPAATHAIDSQERAAMERDRQAG